MSVQYKHYYVCTKILHQFITLHFVKNSENCKIIKTYEWNTVFLRIYHLNCPWSEPLKQTRGVFHSTNVYTCMICKVMHDLVVGTPKMRERKQIPRDKSIESVVQWIIIYIGNRSPRRFRLLSPGTRRQITAPYVTITFIHCHLGVSKVTLVNVIVWILCFFLFCFFFISE